MATSQSRLKLSWTTADVRSYGLLVLVVAGILGAISVLDRGRIDEAASQTGLVSVTGISGGVMPRIGELAPDFTLPHTTGQSWTLASLRGQPVFVNFWPRWCPPCRSEMPEIQAQATEGAPRGLVVLGVNLQEERQPIVGFARQLGLSFPLLVDPAGRVATRYNVTGLPTSSFIDRDGVIRAMNIGPLTSNRLKTQLAKILD